MITGSSWTNSLLSPSSSSSFSEKSLGGDFVVSNWTCDAATCPAGMAREVTGFAVAGGCADPVLMRLSAWAALEWTNRTAGPLPGIGLNSTAADSRATVLCGGSSLVDFVATTSTSNGLDFIPMDLLADPKVGRSMWLAQPRISRVSLSGTLSGSAGALRTALPGVDLLAPSGRLSVTSPGTVPDSDLDSAAATAVAAHLAGLEAAVRGALAANPCSITNTTGRLFALDLAAYRATSPARETIASYLAWHLDNVMPATFKAHFESAAASSGIRVTWTLVFTESMRTPGCYRAPVVDPQAQSVLSSYTAQLNAQWGKAYPAASALGAASAVTPVFSRARVIVSAVGPAATVTSYTASSRVRVLYSGLSSQGSAVSWLEVEVDENATPAPVVLRSQAGLVQTAGMGSLATADPQDPSKLASLDQGLAPLTYDDARANVLAIAAALRDRGTAPLPPTDFRPTGTVSNDRDAILSSRLEAPGCIPQSAAPLPRATLSDLLASCLSGDGTGPADGSVSVALWTDWRDAEKRVRVQVTVLRLSEARLASVDPSLTREMDLSRVPVTISSTFTVRFEFRSSTAAATLSLFSYVGSGSEAGFCVPVAPGSYRATACGGRTTMVLDSFSPDSETFAMTASGSTSAGSIPFTVSVTQVDVSSENSTPTVTFAWVPAPAGAARVPVPADHVFHDVMAFAAVPENLVERGLPTSQAAAGAPPLTKVIGPLLGDVTQAAFLRLDGGYLPAAVSALDSKVTCINLGDPITVALNITMNNGPSVACSAGPVVYSGDDSLAALANACLGSDSLLGAVLVARIEDKSTVSGGSGAPPCAIVSLYQRLPGAVRGLSVANLPGSAVVFGSESFSAPVTPAASTLEDYPSLVAVADRAPGPVADVEVAVTPFRETVPASSAPREVVDATCGYPLPAQRGVAGLDIRVSLLHVPFPAMTPVNFTMPQANDNVTTSFTLLTLNQAQYKGSARALTTARVGLMVNQPPLSSFVGGLTFAFYLPSDENATLSPLPAQNSTFTLTLRGQNCSAGAEACVPIPDVTRAVNLTTLDPATVTASLAAAFDGTAYSDAHFSVNLTNSTAQNATTVEVTLLPRLADVLVVPVGFSISKSTVSGLADQSINPFSGVSVVRQFSLELSSDTTVMAESLTGTINAVTVTRSDPLSASSTYAVTVTPRTFGGPALPSYVLLASLANGGVSPATLYEDYQTTTTWDLALLAKNVELASFSDGALPAVDLLVSAAGSGLATTAEEQAAISARSLAPGRTSLVSAQPAYQPLLDRILDPGVRDIVCGVSQQAAAAGHYTGLSTLAQAYLPFTASVSPHLFLDGLAPALESLTAVSCDPRPGVGGTFQALCANNSTRVRCVSVALNPAAGLLELRIRAQDAGGVSSGVAVSMQTAFGHGLPMLVTTGGGSVSGAYSAVVDLLIATDLVAPAAIQAAGSSVVVEASIDSGGQFSGSLGVAPANIDRSRMLGGMRLEASFNGTSDHPHEVILTNPSGPVTFAFSLAVGGREICPMILAVPDVCQYVNGNAGIDVTLAAGCPQAIPSIVAFLKDSIAREEPDAFLADPARFVRDLADTSTGANAAVSYLLPSWAATFPLVEDAPKQILDWTMRQLSFANGAFPAFVFTETRDWLKNTSSSTISNAGFKIDPFRDTVKFMNKFFFDWFKKAGVFPENAPVPEAPECANTRTPPCIWTFPLKKTSSVPLAKLSNSLGIGKAFRVTPNGCSLYLNYTWTMNISLVYAGMGSARAWELVYPNSKLGKPDITMQLKVGFPQGCRLTGRLAFIPTEVKLDRSSGLSGNFSLFMNALQGTGPAPRTLSDIRNRGKLHPHLARNPHLLHQAPRPERSLHLHGPQPNPYLPPPWVASPSAPFAATESTAPRITYSLAAIISGEADMGLLALFARDNEVTLMPYFAIKNLLARWDFNSTTMELVPTFRFSGPQVCMGQIIGKVINKLFGTHVQPILKQVTADAEYLLAPMPLGSTLCVVVGLPSSCSRIDFALRVNQLFEGGQGIFSYEALNKFVEFVKAVTPFLSKLSAALTEFKTTGDYCRAFFQMPSFDIEFDALDQPHVAPFMSPFDHTMSDDGVVSFTDLATPEQRKAIESVMEASATPVPRVTRGGPFALKWYVTTWSGALKLLRNTILGRPAEIVGLTIPPVTVRVGTSFSVPIPLPIPMRVEIFLGVSFAFVFSPGEILLTNAGVMNAVKQRSFGPLMNMASIRTIDPASKQPINQLSASLRVYGGVRVSLLIYGQVSLFVEVQGIARIADAYNRGMVSIAEMAQIISTQGFGNLFVLLINIFWGIAIEFGICIRVWRFRYCHVIYRHEFTFPIYSRNWAPTQPFPVADGRNVDYSVTLVPPTAPLALGGVVAPPRAGRGSMGLATTRVVMLSPGFERDSGRPGTCVSFYPPGSDLELDVPSDAVVPGGAPINVASAPTSPTEIHLFGVSQGMVVPASPNVQVVLHLGEYPDSLTASVGPASFAVDSGVPFTTGGSCDSLTLAEPSPSLVLHISGTGCAGTLTVTRAEVGDPDPSPDLASQGPDVVLDGTTAQLGSLDFQGAYGAFACSYPDARFVSFDGQRGAITSASVAPSSAFLPLFFASMSATTSAVTVGDAGGTRSFELKGSATEQVRFDVLSTAAGTGLNIISGQPGGSLVTLPIDRIESHLSVRGHVAAGGRNVVAAKVAARQGSNLSLGTRGIAYTRDPQAPNVTNTADFQNMQQINATVATPSDGGAVVSLEAAGNFVTVALRLEMTPVSNQSEVFFGDLLAAPVTVAVTTCESRNTIFTDIVGPGNVTVRYDSDIGRYLCSSIVMKDPLSTSNVSVHVPLSSSQNQGAFLDSSSSRFSASLADDSVNPIIINFGGIDFLFAGVPLSSEFAHSAGTHSTLFLAAPPVPSSIPLTSWTRGNVKSSLGSVVVVSGGGMEVVTLGNMEGRGKAHPTQGLAGPVVFVLNDSAKLTDPPLTVTLTAGNAAGAPIQNYELDASTLVTLSSAGGNPLPVLPASAGVCDFLRGRSETLVRGTPAGAPCQFRGSVVYSPGVAFDIEVGDAGSTFTARNSTASRVSFAALGGANTVYLANSSATRFDMVSGANMDRYTLVAPLGPVSIAAGGAAAYPGPLTREEAFASLQVVDLIVESPPFIIPGASTVTVGPIGPDGSTLTITRLVHPEYLLLNIAVAPESSPRAASSTNITVPDGVVWTLPLFSNSTYYVRCGKMATLNFDGVSASPAPSGWVVVLESAIACNLVILGVTGAGGMVDLRFPASVAQFDMKAGTYPGGQQFLVVSSDSGGTSVTVSGASSVLVSAPGAMTGTFASIAGTETVINSGATLKPTTAVLGNVLLLSGSLLSGGASFPVGPIGVVVAKGPSSQVSLMTAYGPQFRAGCLERVPAGGEAPAPSSWWLGWAGAQGALGRSCLVVTAGAGVIEIDSTGFPLSVIDPAGYVAEVRSAGALLVNVTETSMPVSRLSTSALGVALASGTRAGYSVTVAKSGPSPSPIFVFATNFTADPVINVSCSGSPGVVEAAITVSLLSRGPSAASNVTTGVRAPGYCNVRWVDDSASGSMPPPLISVDLKADLALLQPFVLVSSAAFSTRFSTIEASETRIAATGRPLVSYPRAPARVILFLVPVDGVPYSVLSDQPCSISVVSESASLWSANISVPENSTVSVVSSVSGQGITSLTLTAPLAAAVDVKTADGGRAVSILAGTSTFSVVSVPAISLAAPRAKQGSFDSATGSEWVLVTAPAALLTTPNGVRGRIVFAGPQLVTPLNLTTDSMFAITGGGDLVAAAGFPGGLSLSGGCLERPANASVANPSPWWISHFAREVDVGPPNATAIAQRCLFYARRCNSLRLGSVDPAAPLAITRPGAEFVASVVWSGAGPLSIVDPTPVAKVLVSSMSRGVTVQPLALNELLQAPYSVVAFEASVIITMVIDTRSDVEADCSYVTAGRPPSVVMITAAPTAGENSTGIATTLRAQSPACNVLLSAPPSVQPPPAMTIRAGDGQVDVIAEVGSATNITAKSTSICLSALCASWNTSAASRIHPIVRGDASQLRVLAVDRSREDPRLSFEFLGAFPPDMKVSLSRGTIVFAGPTSSLDFTPEGTVQVRAAASAQRNLSCVDMAALCADSNFWYTMAAGGGARCGMLKPFDECYSDATLELKLPPANGSTTVASLACRCSDGRTGGSDVAFGGSAKPCEERKTLGQVFQVACMVTFILLSLWAGFSLIASFEVASRKPVNGTDSVWETKVFPLWQLLILGSIDLYVLFLALGASGSSPLDAISVELSAILRRVSLDLLLPPLCADHGHSDQVPARASRPADGVVLAVLLVCLVLKTLANWTAAREAKKASRGPAALSEPLVHTLVHARSAKVTAWTVPVFVDAACLGCMLSVGPSVIYNFAYGSLSAYSAVVLALLVLLYVVGCSRRKPPPLLCVRLFAPLPVVLLLSLSASKHWEVRDVGLAVVVLNALLSLLAYLGRVRGWLVAVGVFAAGLHVAAGLALRLHGAHVAAQILVAAFFGFALLLNYVVAFFLHRFWSQVKEKTELKDDDEAGLRPDLVPVPVRVVKETSREVQDEVEDEERGGLPDPVPVPVVPVANREVQDEVKEELQEKPEVEEVQDEKRAPAKVVVGKKTDNSSNSSSTSDSGSASSTKTSRASASSTASSSSSSTTTETPFAECRWCRRTTSRVGKPYPRYFRYFEKGAPVWLCEECEPEALRVKKGAFKKKK